MRPALPARPGFMELQTAHGGGTVHPGGGDATEHLLRQLDPRPGSTILDLGCGSGETACNLAARQGCLVIGIDLSPYQVATAQSRTRHDGLADRVSFSVASAEQLPFRLASFDHVLVQSVLSFVPDPRRALRECARVLRPGGTLALNEATAGPGTPLRPPTRRFRECGYAYRQYTAGHWRTLLEGEGFTVQFADQRVGRRRFRPRLIARWGRAAAEQIAGHLRANVGKPERWADALLFVDFFRRFTFVEAPHILLVARSASTNEAMYSPVRPVGAPSCSSPIPEVPTPAGR